MNNGEKIIGAISLWRPTGVGQNPNFERFLQKKLFMEKSSLCQLKALINSFNVYLKHFSKNHSIRHYGQKYGFLSENSDPSFRYTEK